MRKKQRLKILLKILISLFIIFGAAAILLAGIRKTRIAGMIHSIIFLLFFLIFGMKAFTGYELDAADAFTGLT